MPRSAVATAAAPGKVILIGEHSAVYGRPALVAALDRKVRVRLESRHGGGDGVLLRLGDLGVEAEAHWAEIRAVGDAALRDWRAYDDAPGPETFARVARGGAERLAWCALAEAVRGERQSDLPPILVDVRSELPVGAGFGSSAALAVATVLCVRRGLGFSTDVGDVFARALEVERRQHGRPSGIDVAAAVHGGLLRARRDGETLRTESVEASAETLAGFDLYLTGTPSESTGAVVAEVGRRLEKRPDGGAEVLDAMERATRTVERWIAEGGRDDPEAGLAPLRAFQRHLESLGVVPDEVRSVVRYVEERGGAAKVSGAGALSGPGAGALLVYHPQSPIDLSGFPALRPIEARLGCPGASLQNAQDQKRTP